MKHTKNHGILLRSLGLLLSILMLMGLLAVAAIATEDGTQTAAVGTTDWDPSAPKGDTRGMEPREIFAYLRKDFVGDPSNGEKTFHLNIEYKLSGGNWAPASEEAGFTEGWGADHSLTMKPGTSRNFTLHLMTPEIKNETMYLRVTEDVPEDLDGVYYEPADVEFEVEFDDASFADIVAIQRNDAEFSMDDFDEGTQPLYDNYEAEFLTETIYKSYLSQSPKNRYNFSFLVEEKDASGNWIPLSTNNGGIRLLEEPSITTAATFTPQPVEVKLAFLYGNVRATTLRITEKIDNAGGNVAYDRSQCILEIDLDAAGKPYVKSRTQNGQTVDSFQFENRDYLRLDILKFVSGEYASDFEGRSYAFQLKATAPEGYTGPLYTVASYGDVDLESDGMFYLKDGQRLSLKDIPYGTTITVEEIPATGCTTDGKIFYGTMNSEGVNLSDNPREITYVITDPIGTYYEFTNSYDSRPTAELLITKNFYGNFPKPTQATFAVEVLSGNNWVPLDSSTEPRLVGVTGISTPDHATGKTQASLKLELSVHPAEYKSYKIRVREQDMIDPGIIYDKAIYTFTVFLNKEGDLVIVDLQKDGVPAEEIVFNNYQKLSLQIAKSVSGNAPEMDRRFQFKLTATAPQGYTGPLYTADGFTIEPDGTFYLKPDTHCTLTNIPYGTIIKVMEEAVPSYQTSVYITQADHGEVSNEAAASNTAQVTADLNDIKVTFTNSRNAEIDTGVVLDSLPYVVILALVAVGGFFFLRKRRQNEE